MQLGLAIHGAMLADEERNQALAAAIGAVVRPDDVVVDVGTGTGLLAMLAARAGARQVYAIEVGPLAGVARHLIERNRFNDRVVVVHASSREFDLPERADVVLCETLGFAALDERFRTTMVDARDRFLRPGGRLLPAALDICLAPIVERDAVRLTRMDTLLGFDFVPLADVLRKVYQRRHIPREDELGPPVTAFHLACDRMSADEPLRCQVECQVSRGGMLGGFGLWFDAELAPDIRMNSRSPHPRNHWGQAFLPLPEPRRVAAGDRIPFELAIDDRQGVFRVRWEAGSPVAVMPAAMVSETHL